MHSRMTHSEMLFSRVLKLDVNEVHIVFKYDKIANWSHQ